MKKTKSFPQVWKLVHPETKYSKEQTVLYIVYRNRVETYTKDGIIKQSKAEIDAENPDCHYDYEDIFGKGWNAYHEIDMLKANGFRQVKDESEVRE